MTCAWIDAIDQRREQLDLRAHQQQTQHPQMTLERATRIAEVWLRSRAGCEDCAAVGELCDACSAAEEAMWD